MNDKPDKPAEPHRDAASADDEREHPSPETSRRQAADSRLDDVLGREPHDVHRDDETDSGERRYGAPDDDPTFSPG